MQPAVRRAVIFGGNMAKQAKFKPKDATVPEISVSGDYSHEQIEQATKEAIAEERGKDLTVFQKINVAWTLISTLYAIVSVCTFIAKKWVDSVYTYALIPLLAIFIIVFIALAVLTFKDPKRLKNGVSTYRKALGVFKAFVNVFFLALTAVSMAGIATGEPNLVKWIVFGFTLLVALVQLALKITKFAMRCAKKSLGKKYKVEIHNFKNGERKKKTNSDKMKERSYK